MSLVNPPNKRQLLALEYLYGRAVGVDECGYLASNEPATWQLVKVMAAVAELNEWHRRLMRDEQERRRRESGGSGGQFTERGASRLSGGGGRAPEGIAGWRTPRAAILSDQ